ncbi:hypothetical protein OE88DRAFT_1657558 [Heliocybe sulcata]|uniref:Uncharacterized protein n=1 Tax=Heliocybe sulcata TaxID=5364 RepID=A0A5C3N3M5_9AGAM|nr:hypothetical protein OE88DRAFT_1657558 [Heliocybe sulcata]
MSLANTLFLLSYIPSLCAAVSNDPRGPPPNPLSRRASKNVPSQGYYDPLDSGGGMLTQVPDTYPAGLGEPINVILSGNSDAAVLVDQQSDGGLRNYYQSLGFSSECLGQHSGSDQAANLGDGNGYKNETAVIRWDYGDPAFGTCTETVEGGNHFRYWVQDGPDKDSGAIFMALSYEKPIALGHDIIVNGYNLARDWLIGNATGQSIPTANLTNSSSYSGSTSAQGYTYQTSVNYVSGLLQNTSDGINHYLTVGVNGSNAIDGLVAVMEVHISARPAGTSDALSWRLTSPWSWNLPTLLNLGVLLILPLYALS